MAIDRHILAAVFGEPWAITPEKLAVIAELVQHHAAGLRYTPEEIQERLGGAGGADAISAASGGRPLQQRAGSVAVIPVFGVLRQRMNMLTEMSGGTSTEQVAAAYRQAMADPSVKAVVLQVDSPGGSVSGTPELAAEMQRLRGQKPVVAVADTLMASAAYWIACQADEVVASPSALMGSIGVIAAHQDESAAEAAAGVKTTLITAGKYKSEGSPYGPLSAEAMAAIQERVNYGYAMFVNDVARGRGVKVSEVRAGFGEGRVVTAQQAVTMGMADRVDTMAGVLRRLGAGSPAQAASMGALAELAELAELAASARTPAGQVDLRRRRLELTALPRR